MVPRSGQRGGQLRGTDTGGWGHVEKGGVDNMDTC